MSERVNQGYNTLPQTVQGFPHQSNIDLSLNQIARVFICARVEGATKTSLAILTGEFLYVSTKVLRGMRREDYSPALAFVDQS